ncbi:MAG: tetratricopeptide repeat protein [Roseiflexaceae bacterium]
MAPAITDSPMIDAFWEYQDPALSEQRFRELLPNLAGDLRLEVLTQIARTYSLRRLFDQAHTLLDQVAPDLLQAGMPPQVRYLLERGRCYRSAGSIEQARGLFLQAWEQANSAGLEGLAVDAAHMVAITYPAMSEAIDWNQQALVLARGSQDPKAQALLPALLNNLAWDLHDQGQYEPALALFEEAQLLWEQRQKHEQIQIARWSVARCLRSLGRYQQALSIQRALEQEHQANNQVDGYVFEELAENLRALGETTQADHYAALARQALGQA